ncbi:MAG: hypothetical protein M1820_008796 [Bogoriella megaspora]|nr:MAG: hypothetical protein M1820_008796 [Bogoriella megaspora]
MSLFGGDGTASRETSPAPRSTLDEEYTIPTSAQAPASQNEESPEPPDMDEASSRNADSPASSSASSPVSSASLSDSGSDSSSEVVSDSSIAPSTDEKTRSRAGDGDWQYWTAPERALFKSLRQQQANDLSIHLYNAHALKALFRDQEKTSSIRPWTNKNHWMKLERQSIKHTREWHPPDNWTAWPLPPDQVPRENEIWGAPREDDDELDQYTFKKEKGWQKASKWLEETITGSTLTIAREKWDSREWMDGLDERRYFPYFHYNPKVRKAPSMPEGDTVPSESDSDNESDDTRTGLSEQVREDEVVEIADASTSTREPAPAFLADDDCARTLLTPTVRSMIANVDKLLGSLHSPARIARQSEASNTSQQASLVADQRLTETNNDPHPSNLEYWKRQQDETVASESGSHATMHESEIDSAEDYSADEEADGPPMLSQLPERDSNLGKRKRHRRGGARSAKRPCGLRDWSEVLNAASLQGWDRNVVHRAAARCSALFGEGMSFNVSHSSGIDHSLEETVKYTPEIIPPLPVEESFDAEAAYEANFGNNVFTPGEHSKCPIRGCTWGFDNPRSMIAHWGYKHNIKPPADWRRSKYGGVHINGFLQPLNYSMEIGEPWEAIWDKSLRRGEKKGGTENQAVVPSPTPSPSVPSSSSSLSSDDEPLATRRKRELRVAASAVPVDNQPEPPEPAPGD